MRFEIFFAFFFVGVLIFTVQFVHAKGRIEDDAKGVVLGAAVARSDKEKISQLPVETYFGKPDLPDLPAQISDLGITVYPEDIVTNFPDSQMNLGSIIRITRATPIKVQDGKKESEYHTWVGSVRELLEEKDIELGLDDKIEPAQDSALTPNMAIAIVRVEITKVTVKETIDFKKTIKDDPTLDKGLTKTVQVGKKGERTKVFEVRRENGEEVSRKLLENKITKEAVEEIVARGTKEVVYGVGKATWFAAPALSAAHNSLPRGSKVLVTNLANGKSVEVTVVGGGIQGGAVIDLSPDAFAKLAPLGSGVIQVKLTKP